MQNDEYYMRLHKRPHEYSAFCDFSHVACNSIELQKNKRLSLNVIKLKNYR